MRGVTVDTSQRPYAHREGREEQGRQPQARPALTDCLTELTLPTNMASLEKHPT